MRKEKGRGQSFTVPFMGIPPVTQRAKLHLLKILSLVSSAMLGNKTLVHGPLGDIADPNSISVALVDAHHWNQIGLEVFLPIGIVIARPYE